LHWRIKRKVRTSNSLNKLKKGGIHARFFVQPILIASFSGLASICTKLSKPFRQTDRAVWRGRTRGRLCQVLAQHLSEETKQSFVVEDRPGAGSIIGTDAVAKSAPDGYTLLVMSNTHTTNESLLPNKPFQLMRDFVPVATVNYSDLLMVVHPSVPAKSVKEFIDLAKKEPGKLNYASSGPGTPYHMAGELFKAMSQTDIVHVPHKASGDARNSVVSGTVQMMFDAVTTMTALAKGGQVRALAMTGLKRSELTPDLLTVAETVPGYEATI
jgi:tripartite-type tricarboxylate transporter receptor subunit TctC